MLDLVRRRGFLENAGVVRNKTLVFDDDGCIFVPLLRKCARKKDLHEGIKVHNEIVSKGLLDKCSNALITMYAKCGALSNASQLLDVYKSRDVTAWTSIVAGYAEKGQPQDALNCFERMQHEGISPDAVTFACALKACGSMRAASQGEQIHDEIARQGLLSHSLVLGTSLVDMYAKCGALAKARQVLENLPTRDIVSWNALVTGYAQQGEGEQVLDCFKQIQQEGLFPNAVTLVCVLKACGNLGAIDRGEQIHDEISRHGLMYGNAVLSTALVDMYARCGALAKAAQLLDNLPVRDVPSWNALISGYVHQDQGKQALKCFESMQHEGLHPHAVTFTCVLKACGSIGAVDKGEEIHEMIARQGLLKNNNVLGTALVDMYVKCGNLPKAQQVLEGLPSQDVTPWNALIAGYVEQDRGQEVLNCLEKIRIKGLSPDAATFVSALKVCGTTRAADKGKEMHDEIVRQGLLGDNLMLGTAVVDMYVKCGAIAKAQQVLDGLQARDVTAWNVLIAGYTQYDQGDQVLHCFERMDLEGILPDVQTFTHVLKACGSLKEVEKGTQIHDEIARQGLLQRSDVLGTALVDMYAKCGAFLKAQRLLDELPVRDVTSWSALIGGYAQHGQGEQAVACFERMQLEGLSPDALTYASILKACASVGAADRGQEIHVDLASKGLMGDNIVLGSAVIDMYVKCGALAQARKVHKELPFRNISSWSALIAGYAEQGQAMLALGCFEEMDLEDLSPDKVGFACILKACGSIGAVDKGEIIHGEIARHGMMDIVLGTALVDMYAKCGALLKAQGVLEELPMRDATSWNALIAGYAQEDQAEQALSCLELMQREGLSPDATTFTCTLKACGSIGALDKGEQIHDEIARQGLLGNNVVLGTAVVDMYAKCGAPQKAQRVFEILSSQHVTSWNALIAGYAQQGHGEEAVYVFERMQQAGVSPDAVTFCCVLSACSLLGLVDDAHVYFVMMSSTYGIKPELEHYTCMISLFGRAGHLNKAVELINQMPSSDYSAVWSAMLGGCRKWGDVSAARWAFEHAVQVDKSEATSYVFMASIYAAAGMQQQADEIEVLRKENKAWTKEELTLWADVDE